MKLILPAQIRDLLVPLLTDDLTAVWVNGDGEFDGDPAGAVAYFRWWGEQEAFLKVIRVAHDLRWVHTPSAGVDHLLVPEIFERDLILTNSAGVHAIPMAEFVFAMLLNRVKQLPTYQAAQAECRWARGIDLHELYGATMLILGIGGIGDAIAQRAVAFGMRVWGSRRTNRPSPYAERVVTGNAWHALLPEADYVVVAAPLTPETRGMINAETLAMMRPSAFLVNVARGPLVDEQALIEALQQGRIAGAALDTFAQEPLPPASPLWHLPNVMITPHATANSLRMHERQVALFLDNLQRFQRGQPLLNLVDKAAGY
ncbi:D-2-hydroxyacid dehydrogenase [Candidatus Chloroploca sp. Khr17]|uniref:D-2-hydroxyacid dehydrogenase n=1 Tax=Candidatus Chloroploca sp. Khr17 TaxID=2496869 RepID=UPI00101CE482|nr:D-2-hydroxyacid dehydrogenase [Candidatus Chloroploca sp. Khr17]